MSRTPQEYIDNMKQEAEEYDLFDLTPHGSAHYDQLAMSIKDGAATVGLNTESVGYKASVLFTCDLLDHLANSLESSEEMNREIGAEYLREAANRLRTLSLWGERCQSSKGTCLDLR